ncbi:MULTISPECIES: hypothetical protein [unclassified Sinorhizobium]|uniref:hypothetical protein n=1 Tax=unclassified Sinorhizobium TaxID=2613772 RepID=UPI003525FF80
MFRKTICSRKSYDIKEAGMGWLHWEGSHENAPVCDDRAAADVAAVRLAITATTVRAHLSHIFLRAGVRKQVALWSVAVVVSISLPSTEYTLAEILEKSVHSVKRGSHDIDGDHRGGFEKFRRLSGRGCTRAGDYHQERSAAHGVAHL